FAGVRASFGLGSGLLRRDPFRPERIFMLSLVPRRPPPPNGPPPRFQAFQQPTIYIQLAWNGDHPQLQKLENQRDEKIKELDEENQAALAQLKERLLWIGCATLATVIIGGWVLVGIGLFPLKRLSHAVSQVSAKDFRLPIDPKVQPQEVAPVVERLQ